MPPNQNRQKANNDGTQSLGKVGLYEIGHSEPYFGPDQVGFLANIFYFYFLENIFGNVLYFFKKVDVSRVWSINWSSGRYRSESGIFLPNTIPKHDYSSKSSPASPNTIPNIAQRTFLKNSKISRGGFHVGSPPLWSGKPPPVGKMWSKTARPPKTPVIVEPRFV